MVLLFLYLGDIRLKAHVFKPVSVPQLHFDLIQTKELDCLNLADQVLLAKLFVALSTLCILTVLVLGLAQRGIIAQCPKDGIFSHLLRVLFYFLQDLKAREAEILDQSFK